MRISYQLLPIGVEFVHTVTTRWAVFGYSLNQASIRRVANLGLKIRGIPKGDFGFPFGFSQKKTKRDSHQTNGHPWARMVGLCHAPKSREFSFRPRRKSDSSFDLVAKDLESSASSIRVCRVVDHSGLIGFPERAALLELSLPPVCKSYRKLVILKVR